MSVELKIKNMYHVLYISDVKMVVLNAGGCREKGGGWCPTTTFGQKHLFLFLLPFDAEAFKTCKNTIKLN